MNPRQTQEQIGLFSTLPTPTRAGIDAIRIQAMQARDAALAGMLRRGIAALGQALASVGSALLTWPQRRAAYENLRRLNDRELADIGLTRGEAARVFEPDFTIPARPANANQAPARAQAA